MEQQKMNLKMYEMGFKNKKKFKVMEETKKKREKAEITKNTNALDLRELIEKTDTNLLNKEFVMTAINNIKEIRSIKEKEVAKAILYMAEFQKRTWNIKGIVEGIKGSLEDINWRSVYTCFLEEDFTRWSLESLYVIIDCWVCISGIITVPYEIFFTKWKNVKSQIHFIKLLIESDDKKTQLYSNVFFRKIIKPEEVRNAKFKSTMNYESTFNCVELFICIQSLNSRDLIDKISKKSPEWCVVGLSYIYPMFENIFDDLMVNFLRGPSGNFIFYILFRNIPKIILQNLPKYLHSGISLSKILDIVLEQKMLPLVSDDLDPPNICLDIIVLSSNRDHLNLNIWLNNTMATRKDAFANIIINYIEFKLQDVLDTKYLEFAEISGQTNNFTVDKIFPLTVDLIMSFIRSIEQFQNQLSFETLSKLNHLKKQIPNICKLKKGLENNMDEQASSFISSIINSQMSIKKAVENIDEMQKGDTNSKELAFRVFSTLIENYTALYRLPNSDLLAEFYGELIRKDIIAKPFLKVALGYIKESLRHPEIDREFHFAFKCLESFVNVKPSFLSEIEDIEMVKNNLIKKDLLIVDEEFYTKTSFRDFFSICFNNSKIKNEYILLFEALKSNLSFKNLKSIKNINLLAREEFVLTIVKNIYTECSSLIFNISELLSDEFQFKLVYACLDFMKLLLSNYIENEINFVRKIAILVGRLTLAKNRIVVFDKFDFKKFLIQSIESRRIMLGVTFTCNFIIQGKLGKVFIPNNPWLMTIINILGSLYACTLKDVRSEIESLYKHFKLLQIPSSPATYKLKSRDYLLEYNLQIDSKSLIPQFIESEHDTIKHVLALAIDFSIREIVESIVQNACETSLRTGITLFKTIEVAKGSEFSIFRNLIINLTVALCQISAQDPLKACVSGNINYFLKISGIEFSQEEVNQVVENNIKMCCNLIQKAGVSRVSDFIKEAFEKTEVSVSTEYDLNLDILENHRHVERVIIKPITPSEYQDLKAHLMHLSRKNASEARDIISEEWKNLLGNNPRFIFNKLVNYILHSEEKDLEAVKLCKYITGHLIKSEGRDQNSDFLFKCLREIFRISTKTQKEVLGWLIYSSDPRRFSVGFVRRFIEYRLINLVEYDQALSKTINKDENLEFAMNLLKNLLTGDIQLCTVYDFIATLEALASLSDNAKVYDFFQIVSHFIMVFDTFDNLDFEDFIKNEMHNIFIETKKQKIICKNIEMRSAFKLCWEHFVEHYKSPTDFCFFKVDLITKIVKTNLSLYIKDTLEIFIEAYKSKNYLFSKFYARFLIKLLDILEETPENQRIMYDILNLLRPSKVPFFTSGYLEVVKHDFIKKIFDFNMAEECLFVLNYEERYLFPVTQIFYRLKDNKIFIKAYGIYLSYLCNYKYVHLKNIFNLYRDNISYFDNQNLYFKLRKSLQSNTLILKDWINKSNFLIYLLDNINDRSLVTMYTSDIVKTIISEKVYAIRVITLLWVYNQYSCSCGIASLYNELIKNEWIKKLIEMIESKNK